MNEVLTGKKKEDKEDILPKKEGKKEEILKKEEKGGTWHPAIEGQDDVTELFSYYINLSSFLKLKQKYEAFHSFWNFEQRKLHWEERKEIILHVL